MKEKQCCEKCKRYCHGDGRCGSPNCDCSIFPTCCHSKQTAKWVCDSCGDAADDMQQLAHEALTTPDSPIDEGLDSAIEACIGVMGEPAYRGSYAAPREAFRKILSQTIATAEKRGQEKGRAEERQFILNVLDGIDAADASMGLPPNTKAIRFALQSRTTLSKQETKNEDRNL